MPIPVFPVDGVYVTFVTGRDVPSTVRPCEFMLARATDRVPSAAVFWAGSVITSWSTTTLPVLEVYL